MFGLISGLVVLCLAVFALAVVMIRKKNMHIWLGHYISIRLKGKPKVDGPVHIMFCFVDHYEPQWGRPN
ncbi:hypothetical protein, partial [Oleiphilus sp. HI0128]